MDAIQELIRWVGNPKRRVHPPIEKITPRRRLTAITKLQKEMLRHDRSSTEHIRAIRCYARLANTSRLAAYTACNALEDYDNLNIWSESVVEAAIVALGEIANGDFGTPAIKLLIEWLDCRTAKLSELAQKQLIASSASANYLLEHLKGDTSTARTIETAAQMWIEPGSHALCGAALDLVAYSRSNIEFLFGILVKSGDVLIPMLVKRLKNRESNTRISALYVILTGITIFSRHSDIRRELSRLLPKAGDEERCLIGTILSFDENPPH